jgi:hypothetical protein
MAQARVSGQPVKHNSLLRSIRQQEEVTVIEHEKDCMRYEAGQCTCDTMTDEQIDAELLEKEEAKD